MSAVRTRFCRRLGIDYPIWSVGFGGAGPELVAAVSGAGGFGVLGASGLPADAITAPVARTRELTDRPFGINLVNGAASVDAVIAQGVSLGTRFVAGDEAFIHPAYKQRIVRASAEDTVYHQLYDVWRPDAPHRTLRNRTLREWEAAGHRRASGPGKASRSAPSATPQGSWSPGPGMRSGLRPPTSTGTSSMRPCGPASPAAW